MKSLAIAIGLIALWMPSSVSAEEKVYRGIESLGEGGRLEAVHVDLSQEELPSTAIGLIANTPKLRTLVVAGPRFHDEHLEQLVKSESLRTLVLDSTNVSDAAIAQLHQDRPKLTIHRSQRWAIEQIQGLSRYIAVGTRLSQDHPELRELLGDRFFQEATYVDFSSINDLENWPCTKVLSEELAPLKHLTTLSKLNLTATWVNDAGMHYLEGLRTLENLRIPLEEVSSEGLAPIRELSNLRTFSGSPVNNRGLSHIGSLTKLEHLSINGPGLTDTGLEHLRKLTQLKYLSLGGENINGSGLRFLDGLAQLETLYLGVGVSNLTYIPELQSLRHLHGSGTNIDDAALAPLARCENLETLWLKGTGVGGQGVVHLADLSNLLSLNLDDTQVSDAGVSHLKKISNLQYLYLNQTRISNTGLKQFQEFNSLEHLFIYGLPLNEQGLENLKQLTQLKSLHASIPLQGDDYEGRQALCDELQEALPNCNVQIGNIVKKSVGSQ